MKKIKNFLTSTWSILVKIIYVIAIIVMAPISLIVNLFNGSTLKDWFEDIQYVFSILVLEEES